KKPIIFSSTIEFSYESGADASAYDVYGFNIAGKEYNGISKFEFNDINLWTNIAIAQLEAPSTITITLILRPKVVLNNYKSNDGYYLYETDSLNNRIKNTTYNGEYQSLNIGVTSSYDIQVDSAFTVVVMYSNNGSSYDLHEIKDVGEYWAKITIQLNGGVVITFGEEIRYHILPVTLGVRLGSYKDTNPLTQVYDGTNQLTQESLTNLLKDIVFTGIVESDQALNIRIRSEGVNATFENSIVNTRGLYEVTLMNVILVDGSNLLLQNYKLPNTTIVFKNIGQINPRPIDILGFTPQNKVYDGTNEVVANVENIVFIGKIDGDATEILTENLKFYIDNYSVGRNREVLIDWSNALDGADKNNYTIQYNKTYIDIYPYQLECEIEGYGVFKIVDESRLCLIPIDATLYARAFEKGSREYESVYMAVERSVSDTERLIRGYQLIMQVNTLSIQLPEGVFVYLPKTNKVTKVMQIVANDSSVKLERFNNNEFIVVKIVKGNAVFGVVAKTSYLPLWAIVLIVIGSLAVIGGIVVVVIIIRRKVKGKYSRYDRI
ncbi:MAG: YDG domain-containing protein, partial [Clostridia bacterium]